jgi:hypothetical protein
MPGIFSFLDPSFQEERRLEEQRRNHAIQRVSQMYNCTLDAAKAWLDRSDEVAIMLASQRLNGKPLKIDGQSYDIEEDSYQ